MNFEGILKNKFRLTKIELTEHYEFANTVGKIKNVKVKGKESFRRASSLARSSEQVVFSYSNPCEFHT